MPSSACQPVLARVNHGQPGKKEPCLSGLLRVRLLGDFSITYDDVPVARLNADRVQSLLVYLLLNQHAPQPRHHIAFRIWPDSTEAQARSNLRTLLHQLRAALPEADQFLETSQHTLQWLPDAPFTLDVAEFKQAVAAADRAEQDGQETGAREALEQAVALYGGDLLPGSYDDWIMPLREELRQTFSSVLERLITLLAQNRDWQGAIRHAQRLVQHDVVNEANYTQLMRLYAMSGDRAGVRRTYQACVTVLQRELEMEPAPSTREAYEHWLRFEPPTASLAPDPGTGADMSPTIAPPAEPAPGEADQPRLRALPPQPTAFLGREEELADIRRLIRDPAYRLITITGHGGIGKTRLALQVATDHMDSFTHGVAWVSLGSIQAAELLAPSIADALGVTFHGATDPADNLLRYLRDKELLLVLDNFEHLLDEVGLLAGILQNAPGVTLLVTSRVRLNLQEEWVWELQGLPLPTLESTLPLEANSAVALFVQSAQRVDHSFQLDGEGEAVARICRLVEGMPLGLELAAAWVRVLSPSEIEREIERNIDFLTTSLWNVPTRHRSLRAVFNHSWQLLSEEEQRVLRVLSLFRGGFTRDAAAQVAGASLALLASLVDKSLVRRAAAGRYDLHEVVRQYAAAHFQEEPEELDLREQLHARYFAELLAAKDPLLRGPLQTATVAELRADLDNIRQAWEQMVARAQAREINQAAATLWWLYELTGWYQEAEALFKDASESLDRTTLPSVEKGQSRKEYCLALGQVITYHGHFYSRHIQHGHAKERVMEGLALIREGGDPLVLVRALLVVGGVLTRMGELEEATRIKEEGVRICREMGYQWETALTLTYQGVVALETGDYARAYSLARESLDIWRVVRDPASTSNCLSLLSGAAIPLGRYGEALEALDESLILSEASGWRRGTGIALARKGVIAHRLGNIEEASQVFRASLHVFEEIGDRWGMAWSLNGLGEASLALGHLPEARRHFLDALKISSETRMRPFALSAVVGLAEIYAREGDSTRARSLLAQALENPATSPEARRHAEQLVAALPAPVAGSQGDHDASRPPQSLELLVHDLLHPFALPSPPVRNP
jgi:predicted ATPase/DNA-binding SARP family transcriptional activator